MRICVISPIDEQIPPSTYGGIGRVVNELIKGLIARGHDVTLIGPQNSKLPSKIIPSIEKHLGISDAINKDQKAREALMQIAIAIILKELRKNTYDAVSNHFGWRLIPFVGDISTPIITTLHTPLNQLNKQIVLSKYPNTPLISISMNQRSHLPNANYLANIYNGIDLDIYDLGDGGGGYLVFLGRMSSEKGIGDAISIARKLRKTLYIAGAIHEWDKEYFKTNIEPEIDQKQIIFLGEINDSKKNELLGGAEALLAPIQWDEPFGITFIEALACGTPIIAYRRGSVEEIIQDHKTGIIDVSMEGLIKRFNEIKTIDRRECRFSVEKKFKASDMAIQYEELFRAIIKSKKNEKTKR